MRAKSATLEGSFFYCRLADSAVDLIKSAVRYEDTHTIFRF